MKIRWQIICEDIKQKKSLDIVSANAIQVFGSEFTKVDSSEEV